MSYPDPALTLDVASSFFIHSGQAHTGLSEAPALDNLLYNSADDGDIPRL